MHPAVLTSTATTPRSLRPRNISVKDCLRSSEIVIQGYGARDFLILSSRRSLPSRGYHPIFLRENAVNKEPDGQPVQAKRVVPYGRNR